MILIIKLIVHNQPQITPGASSIINPSIICPGLYCALAVSHETYLEWSQQ